MDEFMLMLMLLALADDPELIEESMSDAHDCDKCNAKGHCPLEPAVRDIRSKHMQADFEAVHTTTSTINADEYRVASMLEIHGLDV